ncbi:hypothetical protein Sjap_007678 [Stephania japonica]|uniref:Uncharacterized protein n=1 Tax=Stephania japonica TaxID=461633 RepID=A0AAP0JNG1_9MAGN
MKGPYGIEKAKEDGDLEKPFLGPSSSSTIMASSSSISVVVLGTFFAVSGSYIFGSATVVSSPTQSGIMSELGLSLAEYSFFGSIMTIGAMIGAIRKEKLSCERLRFSRKNGVIE